ncbi:MAG: CYTH domain-containing protein [Rheinheimera sp.]|nr:MAG: CYTH domain-containing protein [Rheinheimera sp.]
MSLEVELKLLLPAQNAAAVFAAVTDYCRQQLAAVEPAGSKTLLNAYFDTAERWFRRHDSGLRTRQKQGQFEQTLKLAGQQHGAAHIRPEYNVPVSGMVPELSTFPAEVWPVGTDVAILQQQLVELFRTDFVRETLLLQTKTGARIELVFDQGIVAGGGSEESICELELELQAGAVSEMFTLCAQLLQRFPLSLGVQSKAERGYLLSEQTPLCWQDFLPADSTADLLSKFLRNQLLVSRNLASDTQLLTQWQQWQARLAAEPGAAALAQAAAAPGSVPQQLPQPQALQLWLLQYSIWLLDPATIQSTLF